MDVNYRVSRLPDFCWFNDFISNIRYIYVYRPVGRGSYWRPGPPIFWRNKVNPVLRTQVFPTFGMWAYPTLNSNLMGLIIVYVFFVKKRTDKTMTQKRNNHDMSI